MQKQATITDPRGSPDTTQLWLDVMGRSILRTRLVLILQAEWLLCMLSL